MGDEIMTNGDWFGHSKFVRADIAAAREADLRAEVERLTEERDRLQHDNDMSLHVVDYQEKDIERLRAEVERLTAANREAAMQAISDGAQTQEALERAVAAEADRDRLRGLLDVAREGLAAIANRPSQMVWGEDHEAREAMREMEAIAEATLVKIGAPA